MACIEDRNRFEAPAWRVYEYDWKLHPDRKAFSDISACSPALLSDNLRDIQAMPTVLAEAAHCALSGDTQICNLTAGEGHPICALSLKILDKGVGTPDRGGISLFPAPFAHG